MTANGKGTSKQSREDRLAAALRENLKKRKDLTRKRAATHDHDTPDHDPDDSDTGE